MEIVSLKAMHCRARCTTLNNANAFPPRVLPPIVIQLLNYVVVTVNVVRTITVGVQGRDSRLPRPREPVVHGSECRARSEEPGPRTDVQRDRGALGRRDGTGMQSLKWLKLLGKAIKLLVQ